MLFLDQLYYTSLDNYLNLFIEFYHKILLSVKLFLIRINVALPFLFYIRPVTILVLSLIY